MQYFRMTLGDTHVEAYSAIATILDFPAAAASKRPSRLVAAGFRSPLLRCKIYCICLLNFSTLDMSFLPFFSFPFHNIRIHHLLCSQKTLNCRQWFQLRCDIVLLAKFLFFTQSHCFSCSLSFVILECSPLLLRDHESLDLPHVWISIEGPHHWYFQLFAGAVIQSGPLIH